MITKITSLLLTLLLLCCANLMAQKGDSVCIVGGSCYKTPSEAFKNAKDGDKIVVYAGTYKDVAVLYANNVTVTGVGGRPLIDATNKIADGLGVWVICGNNTTLDNFEIENEDNGLRGEAAWDQAAIYLKGYNLTMRNMYIHHCMQGFFNRTNADNENNLDIENSIFDFNGDGGGHSHNIYVNHNITNLTMRGVWSRNCNGGHILKVRAFKSDIQGCMFTDTTGVSLSWFIDFPDGGNHKFVGNIVEHKKLNRGSTIIAYGEDVPNPITNNLLIAQNTFINDGEGAFLDKIQKVIPTINQNIFIGLNAPLLPDNQVALKSNLEDPVFYNYRIKEPYTGKVNYAAYRYLGNASFESRSDSLYGAYLTGEDKNVPR